MDGLAALGETDLRAPCSDQQPTPWKIEDRDDVTVERQAKVMGNEQRSAQFATLKPRHIVRGEACRFRELDLGPRSALTSRPNALPKTSGKLL